MSEMITNVNGNQSMIVPGDGQTHYDFGVVDERERIIKRPATWEFSVIRCSLKDGWSSTQMTVRWTFVSPIWSVMANE